jgi:hypothetical protein
MRFSLILISFMVSIALLESFRWTAVRPNIQNPQTGGCLRALLLPETCSLIRRILPSLRFTRGSQHSTLLSFGTGGTKTTLGLLRHLKDRDSRSDSQVSAMPQVEEEISPPYSALPAVVNTVTQEESPSVSDDIQAGIAVVSETIVTELIVSEVALRFWSVQQSQAGTHTRDNHRKPLLSSQDRKESPTRRNQRSSNYWCNTFPGGWSGRILRHWCRSCQCCISSDYSRKRRSHRSPFRRLHVEISNHCCGFVPEVRVRSDVVVGNDNHSLGCHRYDALSIGRGFRNVRRATTSRNGNVGGRNVRYPDEMSKMLSRRQRLNWIA